MRLAIALVAACATAPIATISNRAPPDPLDPWCPTPKRPLCYRAERFMMCACCAFGDRLCEATIPR
jgi:hypothetical protein